MLLAAAFVLVTAVVPSDADAAGVAAPAPPVLLAGNAPAPRDPDGFHISMPVMWAARAPTSNVATRLTTWGGLRAGKLFALGERSADGSPAVGPRFGVDIAGLVALPETEGTKDVSVSRFFFTSEVRALAEMVRLATTFSALSAYGLAALDLGAGVVRTSAFSEDGRLRGMLTHAETLGFGADIDLHHVTVNLELSGGLHDLRPELRTALGLGFRL